MAAFRCKVLLLIAGFGSCVQSATHNYRPLRYTIPRPLIQVFGPEGLHVSIPHTPGIQLFAFHGSINKFLDDVQSADLGGDVLERDGERWAYKNSTVKLRVGDKIYYRLFVVKDNLGYRLQNGMFEVKELCRLDRPDKAATLVPKEDASKKPASSGSQHNRPICETVVSNLTQKVYDSQQQIDLLNETNVILKDMMRKHPESSRMLALDGVNVRDDHLVLVVQAIIQDKLGLQFKVCKIEKASNGRVKFEAENLEEKLEIVRVARAKLKNSKFKIVY